MKMRISTILIFLTLCICVSAINSTEEAKATKATPWMVKAVLTGLGGEIDIYSVPGPPLHEYIYGWINSGIESTDVNDYSFCVLKKTPEIKLDGDGLEISKGDGEHGHGHGQVYSCDSADTLIDLTSYIRSVMQIGPGPCVCNGFTAELPEPFLPVLDEIVGNTFIIKYQNTILLSTPLIPATFIYNYKNKE